MKKLHFGFLTFFVFLLGVLPPAQAIEVQRVESPGGIVAWLVEDHTNPIISLALGFRGGASLEPGGRSGLARLAAGLIDEGAGELDSQAFQRRLEDLSVSMSFDAGRLVFSGSLKTLTRNRDAAFEMLRLAITNPRFDAEPLERVRGQILVSLKRDQEKAATLAGRRFMAEMFPNHPFGRTSMGTIEGVSAVTREDLRAFVGQRLARDNMIVGVVGDIDAQTLGRALDATFAALPAKAAPWKVAPVTPNANGGTIVVEKAVPQSAIQFGHAGLARDDPDFYPAYVLNHVFGGGSFSSRLFDEIREKRGLAYSVGSYLYPLDGTGLVIGSVGTANKSVGEVLATLRSQWRQLAQNGVTQAELDDAKTYLTGSYPLRFSSSGRIASILMSTQLDNLGIDYITRRNQIMAAVTLAEANRVAKGQFDPDRLTVVVVGKPEGIAKIR